MTWRRAHFVRPQQRPEEFFTIHAELGEARRRDQWLAEGMALLAAESERDAREQEDAD